MIIPKKIEIQTMSEVKQYMIDHDRESGALHFRAIAPILKKTLEIYVSVVQMNKKPRKQMIKKIW